MPLNNYSIEELFVGQTSEFERTITEKDVDDFALLSGDTNPLHTDEAYAKTTQFGKPIVHGMLVASFCSRMVGMYLPGRRCLYLAQTLQFKSPVFVGDTLTVSGTVESISRSTGVVQIKIVIMTRDTTVVTGTASVRVL